MGVVYKAEDTTLERTVALKFLAQHLLDDEEAKERFLREAKAAAALDHPNICTVYEIAEVDGKTFISMAFLKGETLEDRIAKGPLSLKDALDIARQASEGLQAAHGEGIFHRDIKPANIQISPEGRATVMDFGLARLTEASRLTKFDTAMGTVAYMSPEQAQGMEVDGRTDLWSLGCVLYEMVSGQRPFQGQYDQALLYEIVHQEPAALTGLRTGVPVELELLASKCLAKDRDDRYQSAKEIAVDLRTLAEKLKSGRSTILRTTNLTPAVPAAMTAAHTLNPAEALPSDAVVMKRSSKRALQATAAVLGIAFLGLLAVHFTESPPEQPTRRFSFDNSSLGVTPAISPDGMHIVYAIPGPSGGLWVQDLDQDEPRQLAGTTPARQPFWSPDSAFVAYATVGELRKISVQGGASGLVCPLPSPGFGGGSWSPDGESIVFSSGGISYKTASQGSSPERLLTASEVDEGAFNARDPSFVPGATDQVLLFTFGTGDGSPAMYVKNLDTGQTAALGPGRGPVYSAAAGHLIYETGNAASGLELWARPFSPETLQFNDTAFPLRQKARWPSVSDDGTLAYLDGLEAGGDAQTLVWRSRTGDLLEAVGQQQPNMTQLALSPDGQRVAVSSSESGNADIWVHDLTRSTKTRLTFEDQPEDTPAWSPSGREIAYHIEGPPDRIIRRAADGTGEPAVLVDAEFRLVRPDWSHDGHYLVYDEFDPSAEMHNDIRYIELGADGQAGDPVMFVSSPADEQSPTLSPDGRYLAYESDQSGRREIYVRPFPEGAGKWQVSVNGGTGPRWRSDDKELYYIEGTTLMAVSVSTESAFTVGQPTKLFQSADLNSVGGGGAPRYDVSADGQRFLTVASVLDDDEEETASPKIRLVQNWYEEFRDRNQ